MNSPVSPLPAPSGARLNGRMIATGNSPAEARGQMHPLVYPLGIKYSALVRLAFVLVGLFLAYLVEGVLPGDGWRHLVNSLAPAILFGACLWTAYDIVRANPRTLWTPIPWFLAASGLFFGLGPLSYTFGDEAMIAYMDSFCPVSPNDLWRTNLLNAIGILLITTAFLGCSLFMDRRRPRRELPKKPLQADRARAEIGVYLFLGIGLPLHYLLILPYELGRLPFTVPGTILALSCLVPLGIFMLAYLATGFGQQWTAFFWLLCCSELVVEFLRFNKSAFLMVLIMAVLGRYMASRKMADLVMGALFTFSVYVALAPIVSWGRNQLAWEGGEQHHASLEERLNLVGRGIELWSMDRLDLEGNKSWWIRLSYANVQTFAINLYDNGRPGDTFGLVIYGPIPRFLWPDKPILTPGLDFSELAGQGRTSHTGIGVFGEAYWNGGWLFVVLSCSYIGVLFAWLSRSALSAQARSEWLLLPCAFLGIQAGAAITDWFATAYVNGMLLYLVYYLLIRQVMGNTRNRVSNSRLVGG